MKPFLLTLVLIAFTSCVSNKKHKTLTSEYNTTCQKIAELENKNEALRFKVDKMESELEYKNDKIKNLQESETFLKRNNDELAIRMNDISQSTMVNADIMKRTILELDKQNQRVLELSQSNMQKDSLNVLLVKKVKKRMSDKKLMSALEKLGFIF